MPHDFELYHKELIDYAKSIVSKKQLSVPPEELVNEAFIKFFDRGKEFSFNEAKRLISGSGWAEFEHEISRHSKFNERFSSKELRNTDWIVCKRCKEDKPPASYYLKTHTKTGRKFLAYICSECSIKERIEWFRNNKKRWAAYMKAWKDRTYPKKEKRQPRPIHDLWKEANRRYMAKQKEELTDVYIRLLLSNKKHHPITPEKIEAKRQELLMKRQQKNIAQKAV
jgi:hypothetical protein